VVVAESGSGRAILGVVDGVTPKGVESEADVQARIGFLRKIGYKLG
jgi:adenosine/AMP kinase